MLLQGYSTGNDALDRILAVCPSLQGAGLAYYAIALVFHASLTNLD